MRVGSTPARKERLLVTLAVAGVVLLGFGMVLLVGGEAARRLPPSAGTALVDAGEVVAVVGVAFGCAAVAVRAVRRTGNGYAAGNAYPTGARYTAGHANTIRNGHPAGGVLQPTSIIAPSVRDRSQADSAEDAAAATDADAWSDPDDARWDRDGDRARSRLDDDDAGADRDGDTDRRSAGLDTTPRHRASHRRQSTRRSAWQAAGGNAARGAAARGHAARGDAAARRPSRPGPVANEPGHPRHGGQRSGAEPPAGATRDRASANRDGAARGHDGATRTRPAAEAGFGYRLRGSAVPFTSTAADRGERRDDVRATGRGPNANVDHLGDEAWGATPVEEFAEASDTAGDRWTGTAAPWAGDAAGPYEEAEPGPVAESDPAAEKAEKLERIRDLYLTLEAIGDDNVDKHFDTLSRRQHELISDYFRQSGIGFGADAAPAGDLPGADN